DDPAAQHGGGGVLSVGLLAAVVPAGLVDLGGEGGAAGLDGRVVLAALAAEVGGPQAAVPGADVLVDGPGVDVLVPGGVRAAGDDGGLVGGDDGHVDGGGGGLVDGAQLAVAGGGEFARDVAVGDRDVEGVGGAGWLLACAESRLIPRGRC